MQIGNFGSYYKSQAFAGAKQSNKAPEPEKNQQDVRQKIYEVPETKEPDYAELENIDRAAREFIG